VDIHNKDVVDYGEKLHNKAHEKFCQEYFRLDVEEKIVNRKTRRVMAYRVSYPENSNVPDGTINSRASTLLRNENVAGRLQYLYESYGGSVEQQYNWTRGKSEDMLISLAFDEDVKYSDRINAIKELNKMRGYDNPIYDNAEEGDIIDEFLKEFGADSDVG